MFDFLNPFHWLRTILGLILIFALLLIPGWKSVFAGKNFSQSTQMLTKNFFGTVGTATGISISYYKSWFQKEGYKKFQEFQQKALKNLEEKGGVPTK